MMPCSHQTRSVHSEMQGTPTRRPVVVILGAGFASIARLGAEGRRSRRRGRGPTTHHVPAAPLSGRHRPPRALGGQPPRTRPLRQPNVAVHRTAVGCNRCSREVRRSPEMAPLQPTIWCWGSAPGQLLRHEAPPSTRFDVHARRHDRLKEHILLKWEAADQDPALIDDGALNVVVVGGGATGVESAGALAELYRSNFVEDLRIPQEKARRPRRGRIRHSSRCSSRTSDRHGEGAGEARRRDRRRGSGRGGRRRRRFRQSNTMRSRTPLVTGRGPTRPSGAR